MLRAVPLFIHRRHRNGSWDSICESCYLTVVARANVRSESELAATEALHVCQFSQQDHNERELKATASNSQTKRITTHNIQAEQSKGAFPLSNFRNTLLSHLPPDVIRRLALAPVTLELLHEIEYPGSPIKNLHFVEQGVASMTTTFLDGSQVEVTIFGYESVIGISALMGTRRSLNRVYTQMAGHGYKCSVAAAQAEFARGGIFQSLCLRYVQTQLLLAMQSAGCNAKHPVEQRLARWLLICADRAGVLSMKLSQDLLAQMLGAARPSVSVAASILRDQGLISYSRGTLWILDLEGLQKASCECYLTIKDHLDNYAEFDTGFTA